MTKADFTISPLAEFYNIFFITRANCLSAKCMDFIISIIFNLLAKFHAKALGDICF